MAWGVTKLGSLSGQLTQTVQSLTGITAAAGALVVVAFAVTCAATVTGLTIADSASNTWTSHVKANPSTTNGYIIVAWSVLTNSLASGSITITRTGSGNLTGFAAGCISLSGGNGSEDTGVANSNNGTSNAPTVTGNSASVSGDIVIVALCYLGSGNTLGEDPNWTQQYNLANLGSTVCHLDFATQVNSGVVGLAYNPSLTSSSKWAVQQMALEVASSPPSNHNQLPMVGVG